MIPRLLMFGIGLAAGYVLGTRDGRTKIDWVRRQLSPIIDNPRVVRARKDVEKYARQQAPVIRKRAEDAAKAAPGVIADAAQDAAGKVGDVAKDVGQRVAEVAQDVTERVGDTAKDVAERVTETARDVAGRVTDTAKDARERGDTAVRRTLRDVGEARDQALEDDEDDADHRPRP